LVSANNTLLLLLLLQGITAMQFYHTWAPTLPDIITHRAGIRTDRTTGKKSFYVGGRVSSHQHCGIGL
jgi:hypothetical protein